MANKSVNIAMLGSGGVGKSAVTVRFVSNHFVSIYDPTIEDSYKTTKCIDGESIDIFIIDTAGQEEFTALKDSYIRQGDAFILVFSITSKNSWLDLVGLRDSIYLIHDKDKTEYIPILICANKKDLEQDRQVSTEEIKTVAEDWNCQFKEVSAKTAEGVEDMFINFVKEILQHKTEAKETEKEKEKKEEVIVKKPRKFKCQIY